MSKNLAVAITIGAALKAGFSNVLGKSVTQVTKLGSSITKMQSGATLGGAFLVKKVAPQAPLPKT